MPEYFILFLDFRVIVLGGVQLGCGALDGGSIGLSLSINTVIFNDLSLRSLVSTSTSGSFVCCLPLISAQVGNIFVYSIKIHNVFL